VEAEIKLWVAFGLIAIGTALISWLLNRSISHLDQTIDDHSKKHEKHSDDISKIHVDLAKTQSGNEAMNESVRLLRHDVKEMKIGVDVYFKEIRDKQDVFFQKVVDLLGRAK
jgi:predicted  nucleic acid-binding Zn-ribbon protein